MTISTLPVWRFMRKLGEEYPRLKSRLIPPKDLDSKAANGVGNYVPALVRLTLSYDEPRNGAGGDSRGMVAYLQHHLRDLATERPYAVINIVRRYGPPCVHAEYASGGSDRTVSVKHKRAGEIYKIVNELCNSTGAEDVGRRFVGPVKRGTGSGYNTSVAAWDPFHAQRTFRP